MSCPTNKEIESEEISARVTQLVHYCAETGCFTRDEIIELIRDLVEEIANEELAANGSFNL